MPFLIVIFGVSGSGKSTLAKEIARYCALRYLDADNFHSREARGLMARGIPLDDALREPWIAAISDHLRGLAREGEDVVLAFSGLKKRYREPLRRTGFRTLFLFLDYDRALVGRRLAAREDHFMPAELLDSQFDALERPVDEPDVLALEQTGSPSQVRDRALALLRARGFLCAPWSPETFPSKV